MEVGKLTVQVRNKVGKGVARRLRAQGLVPGICYGAGLEEPLAIVVNPKALRASLDPVKRHNTVIHVTVEGQNRTITAMLKDHQLDPIRRDITHVDLAAIDPDKPVTVEVPVELTGKPAGAIDGGQLHIVHRSVHVRAKPADIPVNFLVDVSPLKIGDTLHVSDMQFPPGVEPTDSLRLTLVTCMAPEAEAAPAAAAEPAAAEPAKAAAKPAAGKAAAGGAKAAEAKPAAGGKDAGGGKKK
jgi:large subunit ribosomal protein L25